MKLVEEFKKQTLTLLVAALGFVAAFAWRDAISAWLTPLYESAEGATGLTIVATAITIIAIVITIILTKLLAPKKKR